MIHGPSYAAKYNRIIEGYRAEVASEKHGTEAEKEEKIYQFVGIVKNASHKDFNEWYQLYSTVQINEVKGKKRATIHTRTTSGNNKTTS